MFTGIVTDLGRVREIDTVGVGKDARFVFETGFDTATIDIGASIACSGPCLTATEKGADWFAAEASAETLSRTTMGAWRVGDPVNLERSLAMGQELGGHIVTGHVDAVVSILERWEEGASARYVFALPAPLARFVAEKGSVALDGVSLTVNGVGSDRFDVNIIRHTQEVTAFCARDVGDKVNMEVDVLARYVDRQLAVPSTAPPTGRPDGRQAGGEDL